MSTAPERRLSEPVTPSERWQFRTRVLAACVLLTGIAMTQSPGLIVADTKLDLAIAPLDFLQRAAHLWDPEGAFGQVQNQAYGYLWPMGPFFVLGSAIDLPAWVVQRLWLALVMSVALTGTAKLARELGVRSHLACIAAGFAFALSPRMLTTMGPISIEAWPSSLAPWVLLPLVIGATRGSPIRAAALSAFAIAMVGGVNAAATSAVLPLGALWLLTRTRGQRRRQLMTWWPIFTALGTLWWLVPLFMLGQYSPPFLDYIESAANTTFPTTLFDALRGTSNWVPYVDTSSRAGNDLIRAFHIVLNSGVVLALGLIGLLLPRNPHRLFLVLGLLSGLLLVTMGHTGAAQGWFAEPINEALDGPLAPLRNVHKFDPVIRLPLVLGLAWTLEELVARVRAAAARRDRADEVNHRVLVGIACLAVMAASLPAALGRITPPGGFEQVPDYWGETAAWLAEEQDQGVALLVPGSSFATYLWGYPRDEPMQALAKKPWAVRNAVPLVPPGNIRMLDAIEERLAQGRPSSGLATYLRRAGVSHLVVRNDLERTDEIPDPVLVHRAIEGSPGLSRVATFGPEVGGEANLEDEGGQRIVINGGWQDQYPAIEIYAVLPEPSFAVAATDPPVVVGGPEDLLGLTDAGLIADAPARLAVDLAAGDAPPDGPVLLTDGLRSVERNFGRLHDAASQTRTAHERLRLGGRTSDYELPAHDRWTTQATFVGVADVTASTSQADATAYGAVETGQQPFAAIDGRLDTEWVSGPYTKDRHWWQVDFIEPRVPGQVRVTGGGPNRQLVRLRTDSETSEEIVLQSGITRTVPLDEAAEWLRIEDASGRASGRLHLAEVGIPDIQVRRPLVLPELPEQWPAPDGILLRALGDPRTGCAQVDLAIRCVPGRDVSPEEPVGFDRRVSLPGGATYDLELEVKPLQGEGLRTLLLENQPVNAVASSAANPDVRSSALAAIDGDPGTTWTAALDDETPTLTISWLGRRDVQGLNLAVASSSAARLPETVKLEWPSGSETVAVQPDGTVDPDATIRTSQLTLEVLDAETVSDLRFDGSSRPVPIGISNVSVQGVDLLPLLLPTTPVLYDCGSGPTVQVNGQLRQTRVSASPHELFRGGLFPVEVCRDDRFIFHAGQNEVSVRASAAFTPVSAVFARTGAPPATAVPLSASLPDEVTRRITAPASGAVTTRENANPGFTARQGNSPLEPYLTDGWRQGWVTEGRDDVLVVFEPDQTYRAALAAGFLGLILLLAVTLVPTRRWPSQQTVGLAAASFPRAGILATGTVIGGLLAGWSGALVAAVGATVGVLLIRRPQWLVWLGALGLAPAVAAYVVRPWGSEGWAGDHAWVAHQVLFAVMLLSGASADGERRRARRRKGSSRNR